MILIIAIVRRQEALSSPTLNILLNLAIGVTWNEIRIALGLKGTFAKDELEKQYRIVMQGEGSGKKGHEQGLSHLAPLQRLDGR